MRAKVVVALLALAVADCGRTSPDAGIPPITALPPDPAPAPAARDEPPQRDSSSRPLPEGVAPGRVGYIARLGSTRFVIWAASTTGQMPKGLAASPDGRWLFSSNMGRMDGDTISVFRADPLSFERSIDLPGNSVELAVSSDGKTLLSSNMLRWGEVDAISLETFSPIARLYVPGFPKVLLPDPSSAEVYAALWSADGISRLHVPGAVDETMKLPGVSRTSGRGSKNPRGMALTRDGKTLYVANNADQSVSLVDTRSFRERRRLLVGSAPRHVVASPDGARMYVSLTGNDAIAVIDVAKERVVERIPVGPRPKTIAVSYDGRFLYSADFLGDSLTVVELASRRSVRIPLDVLKVSGLAVHPSDDFVYVSGFCTNDVWAIRRIDDGDVPSDSPGPDHENHPCRTCKSSFMACPAQGLTQRPPYRSHLPYAASDG
jgi:YVTN family beta-propeller protein